MLISENKQTKSKESLFYLLDLIKKHIKACENDQILSRST